MPDLTREQFYDRVVQIVRGKFPLVKLSRADQSFSLRLNGHVASLENLYRVSMLRPQDLQRHVERWALELLRVAEGTPDQNASFEELRDRVMPLLVSHGPEIAPPGGEGAGEPIDVADDDPTAEDDADAAGAGSMISQPLVAHLRVAYVIDSDRSMSYIPPSTLRRWGVQIDEVHEQAVANLVKRSEQLAAHAAADEQGQVNLILFQTMDGYDATRLLLPTLHERLREHLGSPFVAGVPNRDILLCFRGDDATVARLRGQIGEDFRNMPNSITDQLLLVTADGIAAYTAAADTGEAAADDADE